MNWLSWLGFGLAIEAKKQEKAEDRRLEQVANHRAELSDGIFALNAILSDLGALFPLSIGQDALDDLQEIAPLFPMEEILSLQGYIGAEQQRYLQNYFTITPSRYNLGQFTKMAIDRTCAYSNWRNLAGLDGAFCGSIWHTLIELICRRRAPEFMQQIIDAMGKILYHFWFLENESMFSAEIRYHSIISNLNFHAEEDQKTAYLHAVMLLQIKLAEKYGGSVTDFEPCLDSEQKCEMDGLPNLCFTVYGKDRGYCAHFYAVRSILSPADLDLIWELLDESGTKEVFFAEE